MARIGSARLCIFGQSLARPGGGVGLGRERRRSTEPGSSPYPLDASRDGVATGLVSRSRRRAANWAGRFQSVGPGFAAFAANQEHADLDDPARPEPSSAVA